MYNLSNICCLCLVEQEKLEDINNDLYQKLIFCIKEVNEIPVHILKSICINCTNQLEQVYEFKGRCLTNIQEFKGYVQKFETEYNNNDALNSSIEIKEENPDNDDNNYDEITIDDMDVKTEIDCSNKVVDPFDNVKVESNEEQKNERPKYICHTCGTEFMDKTILGLHVQLHVTHDRAFACPYPQCEKRFKTKRLLHAHTMNTHVKERIYSCSVCLKSYKQRSYLKIHMRIHNNERPFSCDECGKSFTEKTCLNRHMTTHMTEKPHLCATCGLRFGQKIQLRDHIAAHLNERTHICTICGKRFNRKHTLGKHVKMHTERKYVCTSCGKSYRSQGSLSRHTIMHTGQRFKCSVCFKSFARKEHLTRHNLTHTKERPYSCSVCGKDFNQTASLNKHSKIHFKENVIHNRN